MAGAWSFERSGWGGNKYITPELLREYGIGSGFFRDPEGARNLGWDLEGYAPWAANRTAYDTALSELDTVRKQIETHPTRGKTDSYNKLKGLTESYSNLHTKISDYRKQAKSLEEAYTKDWLSKHHISYDPTREAGAGRYWWDQSKEGQHYRGISETPIDPWNAGHWYQDSSGKSKWITGRIQGQRYTDLGFAPERDEYTEKALDRFIKLPDRMIAGTRGASHDRQGRHAKEFYEDAGHNYGKMWDDPYWGGLWYDYGKFGHQDSGADKQPNPPNKHGPGMGGKDPGNVTDRSGLKFRRAMFSNPSYWRKARNRMLTPKNIKERLGGKGKKR